MHYTDMMILAAFDLLVTILPSCYLVLSLCFLLVFSNPSFSCYCDSIWLPTFFLKKGPCNGVSTRLICSCSNDATARHHGKVKYIVHATIQHSLPPSHVVWGFFRGGCCMVYGALLAQFATPVLPSFYRNSPMAHLKIESLKIET